MSRNFQRFVENLETELASFSRTLKISSSCSENIDVINGIVHLNINVVEKSSLSVFLEAKALSSHPESSLYSFWKINLSEKLIVDHMENELGIFDDEHGIAGFGGHFGKALKNKLTINYINNSETNKHSLKLILTYRSLESNFEMEGCLNLMLIQDNLNEDIFSTVADIVNSNQRTICPSCRNVKSCEGETSHAPSSFSSSTSVKTTGNIADSITSITSPVKSSSSAQPKKRKIDAGTSLFPKRK